MLLKLVDSLRCPADHEESVLVLSVDAWDDGRVSAGTLGCPVCHASYLIQDGTAYFGGADHGLAVPESSPETGGDETPAWRLAAQLDLQTPGGIVLLAGRYIRLADELARNLDVTCILLDTQRAPPGAVAFAIGDRIPLCDAAVRGVAIDQQRTSPAFLIELTRVTAPGGRLVSPIGSPTPPGVVVLARDERESVASVDHRTQLLQLRLRQP